MPTMPITPTIETLIAKQDFFHHFQPICHLHNRKPLGYEALIRSKSIPRVDLLFAAAVKEDVLYKLDTMSVYNAIAAFFAEAAPLTSGAYLFVNIFPSTLAVDSFSGFIDKLAGRYRTCAPHIVFEINETLSDMLDWNHPQFIRNVARLRQHGFLIAFDDIGEGAATLKRMVEIAPDFMKMDRFFGKDLSDNDKKRKIVKFFVDYCTEDSKLILEGIEEAEDLAQALGLGVTLGQGYLLARPGPLPDVAATSFRSIED